MTKPEQQHIKALLQSPQWQVAEKIANELCDKIAYEPKAREDQWSTIYAVLGMEGEIRGIKRFIKELYETALGNRIKTQQGGADTAMD